MTHTLKIVPGAYEEMYHALIEAQAILGDVAHHALYEGDEEVAVYDQVKAAILKAEGKEEVPIMTFDEVIAHRGGDNRHEGESIRDLFDARGIFCATVCDKCEASVRSRYRPEVFTEQYDAAEPIEPDE